jgi:hypothetical protein
LVDPAWASAISVPWFLKSTQTEDPDAGRAAADYRVAAAAVERSASWILDDFHPDVVVMVNGDFASERVIRALAEQRGVRVTTYETAPSANMLFFAQARPACDYNTDELWGEVRNRPLLEGQRREIAELLGKRARGEGAHERYFDTAEADLAQLRAALGINPGNRVLSLFTNVSWDSAALERGVAFPSMVDWIAAAIEGAGRLDETTLVVRLHPAEGTWGTNLDIERAVVDRLGEVPPNVRIVSSTEPLSSYALLDITDTVLTYTTTMGLEAAYRGIPVVVAARTHYRARGFTWDVSSPTELADAMRAERFVMSEEQRELAERYAYAFFFRAAIPFPLVPVEAGAVTRLPATADELRPGRDPYLDLICDRILDGQPFAVPEELAPGFTPSPT